MEKWYTILRILPIVAGAFLVLPLLEIPTFIKVGGMIGFLPTLLLIILTGMAGAYLLRQQGLATLSRFRGGLSSGQLPANEILEGMLVLVGGTLLILPGFLTDILGLLCLWPLTRQWIIKAFSQQTSRYVQKRAPQSTPYHFQYNSSQDSTPRTIEGEVIGRREDRR